MMIRVRQLAFPVCVCLSEAVISEPGSVPDESRLTVLVALAANVAVAVMKLVAGLLTGSGALLSESAHSFGDTSTELLLITALRRSRRPADRAHPFGYGKERYFWSLLAAMGIFISGAIFSVFEGYRTIVERPEQHMVWLNYLVLVIAFLLEATSLMQGLRQAGRAADRASRSVASYVRDPEDPTVKSVVLEDSAALVGLVFAGAGVALHQLTGNALWDGVASLLIGGLLVFASFALARTCKNLLIGQQADRGLIRQIEAVLEDQPEIDDVVDVLTMLVGVDRVLFCARVDFADSVDSRAMEQACVRIDSDLRARFGELDEIFIEPVPRADPDLRARVLARYGRLLADPSG